MAEYQWYPGHMTKAKRMMQEDIKHGHGDGSDELSDAESGGEVFESGSAQRDCARHQMEGVAQAKDDSHDAKETVLSAAASADHDDSERDDCDQIHCVK